MCCSGAKWKKETVHDHKFDFVDVNDFVERSCVTRLKHSFIFLLVLKSTLVYFADLYTVTSLFVFSDRWRASGVEPAIPYQASRIIYSFCISASLLLLAWDALNALQIIRSGDIGLAFTSPFAYKCYVLRSYPHYCFFSHISDSKKATDELAFFVFFTLKGWKRMMFAEAPRQMVAGLTLHAFLTEQTFNLQHPLDIIRNKPPQYTSFLIMLFTFVVFLFSALLTLFAVVVYVPLLCRIQGNLKEYCCHKIDKRIGEILRKRSRRRFARAVKKQMIEALREAAPGSDTHDPAGPPKPTLPNVSIEEVCVYDEPIFADAGRAVGMQAECDSFGKYCADYSDRNSALAYVQQHPGVWKPLDRRPSDAPSAFSVRSAPHPGGYRRHSPPALSEPSSTPPLLAHENMKSPHPEGSYHLQPLRPWSVMHVNGLSLSEAVTVDQSLRHQSSVLQSSPQQHPQQSPQKKPSSPQSPAFPSLASEQRPRSPAAGMPPQDLHQLHQQQLQYVHASPRQILQPSYQLYAQPIPRMLPTSPLSPSFQSLAWPERPRSPAVTIRLQDPHYHLHERLPPPGASGSSKSGCRRSVAWSSVTSTGTLAEDFVPSQYRDRSPASWRNHPEQPTAPPLHDTGEKTDLST